jgi:HK97 family phage major capsid protein
MELKEQIESLQKDVVQLTQIMGEKAAKDQSADVKELSDKLAAVIAESKEKKIQFASAQGSASTLEKKELETRMDELFVASALCTKKDGSFDAAAYKTIVTLPVYQDAIKAFPDQLPMNTVTSTEGLEFIPTSFSSTLQEEIWLALEVASFFGRISMPASTYKLPFSPGRLIARAATGGISGGSEQGTVTHVKGKTAQLTFTAKKIMSIVDLTDELDFDSIVPALNFLRKQLIDGFALAQETMALNGDTGTSTTVNAFTGEDVRKLVNGIRADAVLASATLDLSAATTVTDANFRDLRAKMGKYGKKPSELAYVVNMATYNAMLKFSGYQALYQYNGAVTTTGELGRIDNIPIVVSELMPMGTTAGGSGTDAPDVPGGLTAAGKFDSGAGVKTFGTAALVNKTAYMFGDRKEFSLELWRNPLTQTTSLIGSQRLDFQKILAAADKTCATIINASTVI